MSIIQDALRKVPTIRPSDNEKNAPKAPQKNAVAVSGARAPKPLAGPYILPLAVIFLALALYYFLGQKDSVPDRIDTPIAKAEASPAVQIQKMDAAPTRREEFSDFVLSGIVVVVDKPKAIVNHVFVGVGDAINGAIVHKIGKDSVVLKKKESEITLRMD